MNIGNQQGRKTIKEKAMADVVTMGLDTSSRCSGFSVYKNGKLADYGCIDYTKFKGGTEARRDAMCLSLLRKLNEVNPDIVAIEEDVIGSSTTTRLLSMIIGVVYAWCLAKNRDFEMIQPSVWRGTVQDRDNPYPKKREDVKEWDKQRAQELFGITDNDDVCDAVLLGYALIKKRTEE